jgi:hypothetical protein
MRLENRVKRCRIFFKKILLRLSANEGVRPFPFTPPGLSIVSRDMVAIPFGIVGHQWQGLGARYGTD